MERMYKQPDATDSSGLPMVRFVLVVLLLLLRKVRLA